MLVELFGSIETEACIYWGNTTWNWQKPYRFNISSIYFHNRFSSGESRGCNSFRGLEILYGFSQFNVVLLHIKTGPSRVGDVITPSGPWSTFGPLSCGCSQQDLSRQSILGHPGHMSEPS